MAGRSYGAVHIEADGIDFWPNEARVRVTAPRDPATGLATGRQQIQGISAWMNASDESRLTQDMLMKIWAALFANTVFNKVSVTWYVNEQKGANVLGNLEFKGSLTGWEFFNPGAHDSDISDGPMKGGMTIVDNKPESATMSNILVVQFAVVTTDTGYGALKFTK
jgi:hypothetical protein